MLHYVAPSDSDQHRRRRRRHSGDVCLHQASGADEQCDRHDDHVTVRIASLVSY